jgi:putative component of toxin-antitoxin plasmid stabilization module
MDADWAVEQYRFANGHKPFDSFMRTLSDDALAETFALRRRLRRADVLRPPLSKALGSGLFELRGLKCGVRLFYVFRPRNRVVILDGYLKKRQDIPHGVLLRMRKYKADLEINNESTKI